jgi:DNA-binding MarR family transcriptional regulator
VARGTGRLPETGREPADGIAPQGVIVLADRLHRAAIHLLRRLRKVDEATGLTPPQASALSVLVFGGPRTLNALAAAEQVKPPTMSRLVAVMERDGLATKTADAQDRRVVHVAPTDLGRSLLEAGRARRLDVLKAELTGLSARDRATLANAVTILERLNRAGSARPAAAARAERETAARR